MTSLAVHIPPLPTADIPPGKWVELPAETPLREALCEIVRARSRTVLEKIPAVVQKAGEDPEHVHHLRVATRRLAAVLRIVRLTLPDISVRKLGKTLKKIRGLLGEARDLDVRADFLKTTNEKWPALSGLSHVMERGKRFRCEIQEELERELPDLETQVRGRSEKLVARLWTLLDTSENGTPLVTFGQLGKQVLQQEFDRLRLAAAAWMEERPADAPVEDLHQLRIACKKFRYATEVFATTLPETFQSELYPQLQELQSVLGDIQDAAAATRELLEERSELEDRLVLWLGLESGPGAEVRDAVAGIDGAIAAYATQASIARRTLSDVWDGFVRSKFFEPMGEMLKA